MEKDAQAAEVVRFGVFEADLRTGELYKNGRKIRLQVQPFQILVMLLERSGGVVTHDELRQKLWPNGTFVDFDHGIRTAVNKIREALGDDADNPRFVETLPRHGYRFIAPVKPGVSVSPSLISAAGSHPQIQSIAVLPLENLSRDPEQEYFAEGMTETLITDLAQIQALRVISPTTSMHLKRTQKTLPEIALELNVDAVVEGTVMRSGNRVRVTTNLLHAPTDRHLWANSYEGESQDVLALQGELARAIAEEVRVKVTPEERVRLTPVRRVNPEAFEAYLKGSYALSRIGGRPVTGVEFFREAIVRDPNYIPPYVGLCFAHIQMSFGHGPLPPKDALAACKQAALKALALDPSVAEAHSCLAWVTAFGEWEWQGGANGFRRGLELSRNSVQAHRLYSWYLSAMQRHEEAIAESRCGRKLDPVSLAAGYTAAGSYWWARQYERCAAEAEDLERLDPTYPGAHHLLGGVCLQTGSYEEAIRRFQKAVALSGEDLPVWYVAHLGCAYSRSGSKAEALSTLDQLRSASIHQYLSPYAVAYLHSSLGDQDEAFEWLEKAYSERNPMLAFLKIDPLFDTLHADPRFQDLVRRMNFPASADKNR